MTAHPQTLYQLAVLQDTDRARTANDLRLLRSTRRGSAAATAGGGERMRRPRRDWAARIVQAKRWRPSAHVPGTDA